MGTYYYEGRGVSQDYEVAVEYLQKSSSHNYTDAKVLLGICLLQGTGIPKDEQQAFLLFNEAAQHGNNWGKKNLIKCYREGLGTQKDETKAKEIEKEIDYSTMTLTDFTRKYWNEM